MKALFCGLLLLASLFDGPTGAREMKESVNDVTLKIGEVAPEGKITVQLANSSRKAIRIWKDSNSWGAARWRILLIRKGRLETFFQNPDQDFTMNVPGFREIAGGAHIDQKLDLNGGNWCGLAHCASYNERGFGGAKVDFQSNDLIIAIYDVPFFPESLSMGVWYGVAATSTTV